MSLSTVVVEPAGVPGGDRPTAAGCYRPGGLYSTGNAAASTKFCGYVTGYANTRNIAMAHRAVRDIIDMSPTRGPPRDHRTRHDHVHRISDRHRRPGWPRPVQRRLARPALASMARSASPGGRPRSTRRSRSSPARSASGRSATRLASPSRWRWRSQAWTRPRVSSWLTRPTGCPYSNATRGNIPVTVRATAAA